MGLQLRKLSDEDLVQLYDECLDECYPDLEIAGLKYLTSRALKQVDPTGYRVGYADWLDAELSAGVIVENDGVFYTPN